VSTETISVLGVHPGIGSGVLTARVVGRLSSMVGPNAVIVMKRSG
jgi:hypothetical protein